MKTSAGSGHVRGRVGTGRPAHRPTAAPTDALTAALTTALTTALTDALTDALTAALTTAQTAAVLIVVLFAGCASRVPLGTDGPGIDTPPGLERTPDAVPRVEPLRSGGPNKPYAVFGQHHVPMTDDAPLVETGLASWYGRKFHGRPTSSGEPYDMYAMTAAHKTMPIPSYARVRNPANGREVIVRVNDRGPFSDGRVIDLSYTAALRLGLLRGVAPVQVERLTHAQIRAGVGTAAPAAPMAAAAPSLAVPAAVTVGVVDRPAPPVVAALDDPAAADEPSLSGWWLQLGAFRMRDGALQLQQRTLRDAAAVPAVAVFENDGLHRVQVGPYGSREQAQAAAVQLRSQVGIDPVLLERAPRL